MGRLTIAIVMLLAASSLTRADVGDNGMQFSEKQRRHYEQCFGEVERLQAEVRALSKAPSLPEPAINTYAKQRSAIRLAAFSVRKCHSAFLTSLSQEQRTGLKDSLGQLKSTWTGIQRHLLTLDDDLNQHLLDNGRLMLHVQELGQFVDEYLERYRKLGSDTPLRQQAKPWS